jgi:hypothetical protein
MLSVEGFAPAGQPVRRWPCSFASVARDDLEEGAASGDFDAMERVCRDLEANAHPERQFCAREARNTTDFLEPRAEAHRSPDQVLNAGLLRPTGSVWNRSRSSAVSANEP